MNFNSLAEEMLLERELLYTVMSIRRTGQNARKLDPVAKFIPYFDECELDGPTDDVDDIVGDSAYVLTL